MFFESAGGRQSLFLATVFDSLHDRNKSRLRKILHFFDSRRSQFHNVRISISTHYISLLYIYIYIIYHYRTLII